jgi:hypothetical protein
MASYNRVTILKTHDPSKPNFVGIKPKVITSFIYIYIYIYIYIFVYRREKVN